MRTVKTTITIEFEHTLDFDQYKIDYPDSTIEDAMSDLEEAIIVDDIGHVSWAAENRLPSNMKLSYKFNWENSDVKERQRQAT